MERFIPTRDDVLFGSRSDGDRLVPYQVGMPCLHWEAVIAEPGGEERVLKVIRAQAGSPSGHHPGARRAAPRSRR